MARPPSTDRAFSFDGTDALLLPGIVLVFAATRLIWLVTHPETVSYWEESYRWMAMQEILNGPVHPLLDYQADHYQGGSLVMILLGIPGFALFGESFLAFKLPALFVSTLSLSLLYAIGRRHFGRRVGVLTALAFVAGPPLAAYWGLAVMGFHGEAAFLGLVQILIFLEIMVRQRPGAALHTAFGFACGFGIWFTYSAGLSVAACLGTALFLGPRPTWRNVAAAAAGFSLGLVPWLAYNATRGFAGVGRALEVFGLRESADPWTDSGTLAKGLDFILRDLPRGLLDPSGEALSAGAAALVETGFLIPLGAGLTLAATRVIPVLARRVRTPATDPRSDSARREAVFVVYIVVWSCAYLASRLTIEFASDPIGYRLFTPLAVLSLTPLAISAVGPSLGGWRLAAGAAGAGLYLSASSVATVAFATNSPAGASLSAQAGYRVLGRLTHRKFAPDLERAVAPARRIKDEEQRAAVLFGVGWAVEEWMKRGDTVESVVAQMQQLTNEERRHILRGAVWSGTEALAAPGSYAPVAGEVPRWELMARIRSVAKIYGFQPDPGETGSARRPQSPSP